MAKPPAEDLETFLRRQDAADLVAVLLDLAKDHEAVQARQHVDSRGNQPVWLREAMKVGAKVGGFRV